MTSKHIDLAAKHLSVARMIAETYSKDPSTKVGAMVLGSDGEPLVHAWNGFVRGADDSPHLYANREVKYRHIVHAEMNAIANAARVGAKLKGAVWYVTECPCDKCIGPILQTSPSAIYCYQPTEDFMSRWGDTVKFTVDLCKNLNVPLFMMKR